MSEKEGKATNSSRLGKEAKIGVTVIAVLLAILGVVVTMRVMGSSSDDKLADATDADSGKDKTAQVTKTESLFKDTKSKLFGGSSSPTVVPATAASTRTPKNTTSELDKWKLASDRHESHHSSSSSSAAALSAPPPFMPDPPKPSHADRHERYTLDPPVGKDVDDIKPLREKGNDLRLASPSDGTSSRSEKKYADRYDPNSRAITDVARNPYREGSRYDDATPQPPSPLRSATSYSAGTERSSATIPVAQFDTTDYRSEPAAPKHHHRSSSASFNSNPPPRRDDGKYEVQPNDSYWTISERLYGTGAYFKALAQHNRGEGGSEDRLQPGTLILAPEVVQLEKSYPDLCPKPSRREALQSQGQSRLSSVSTRNSIRGGRTYTVVEGDTLFNIARYELGKAARWAEIYDMNRDVLGKDFNYLTPGTQLVLPDGEKSDTLAQPPSNTYRR